MDLMGKTYFELKMLPLQCLDHPLGLKLQFSSFRSLPRLQNARGKCREKGELSIEREREREFVGGWLAG